MPGSTFVWGAGGARKTPEDIARDRELAEKLMLSGADYSPVGSWTQGAARVAQALLGAVDYREAKQAETEGRSGADKVVAALMGGDQVAPVGDVVPPASGEPDYAPGAVTAVPQQPGGIGTFTQASQPRQAAADPAGFSYANEGAIRNQPVVPGLQGRLTEAVNAVYGPGYSVQVYSGGQPAEGQRTGSVRHDNGRAADVYIVDSNGKRVTGEPGHDRQCADRT